MYSVKVDPDFSIWQMRFSLMNEQNVRLDTNFLLVYKKYGCEKITKSNQNKNVNHTTEKKTKQHLL